MVVEVKNFIGKSEVDDLEKAVGEYVFSQQIIHKNEPDYQLYYITEEEKTWVS